MGAAASQGLRDQVLAAAEEVLQGADRGGGSGCYVGEAQALHASLDHHLACLGQDVVAELKRYGLSTVSPEFAAHSSGDDEEILGRMSVDARRIDFERADWDVGLDDLDIPFVDYLERLRPSGAARGRILGRAFELMGADEREYSALSLLHEFAGFGSAFDGDSRRVAGGADSLARAVAGELGDLVRLGAPVTAVRASATGCHVVTPGETMSARTVIVAAPVNTLAGIEFSPAVPLPGSHPGRVAKVWAPVVGIPAGTVRTSWPGVVEAYTLTGPAGIAVAGFQLHSAAAEREVLGELSAAFPGATFGVPFWHDWCGDPYARGTWSASRPGRLARWRKLADHPGPLFFAGGDLSRRWIGWMDGALTSGADAARRAAAYLGGRPVPAARG